MKMFKKINENYVCPVKMGATSSLKHYKDRDNKNKFYASNIL